jgi:peptidoglycan/LPS O-acetylase OafA/YrhL
MGRAFSIWEAWMKIPEYKTQIVGGVILGLFSLFLYFYLIPTQIVFAKQQMGVSPQYFPSLLAGLLFVLSIALGVVGYRNRNKKNQREYELIWKESKLVLITLVVIALQIVGFTFIGYLIPAMLAIAVCMYIYGHRNYITIAIVSILLPLAVKLFFEKALQVYLP